MTNQGPNWLGVYEAAVSMARFAVALNAPLSDGHYVFGTSAGTHKLAMDSLTRAEERLEQARLRVG